MTDPPMTDPPVSDRSLTDRPTPEGAASVRSEDALDVAAIATWLAEHGAAEVVTDLVGQPVIRQFSGGASNLTYLVRYPSRDLILRTPPRGTKARGAHDMGREFGIQSALRDHFGYVPAMVGFCTDPGVIGADFYVMERVEGRIPRAGWTPAEISPERAGAMCESMVRVLAELHAVDVAATGLSERDKGTGYVGRQVSGWTSRFRNAHTGDSPDFEGPIRWLVEHQPPDRGRCVIHNDFKMDNLVFNPDLSDIVGVLDWEMATVGDPLMDLGGDLAFWVQADDPEPFARFSRVPTHLPGMMTREQFVAGYCAATGMEISPSEWLFYEVFGLFRLAVIAQQIYYRYVRGQTTNPMYAAFGPAVQATDRRIAELLGWE